MRRALLFALAVVCAASPSSAEAQSFDVAQERLRLEAELETVQMNGLFFFGGGFATIGGAVGVGASAVWLTEQSGDVGAPVATLVTFGVIAVACRPRCRRAGVVEAARGVDGRVFPWGSHIEPTWVRIVGSLPRPPGRVPVEEFSIDESPYGVRGMGGNVRDWCASPWTSAAVPSADDLSSDGSDDALLIIRGGAWHTVEAYARGACRFAARPTEYFPNVGFRLARAVELR